MQASCLAEITTYPNARNGTYGYSRDKRGMEVMGKVGWRQEVEVKHERDKSRRSRKEENPKSGSLHQEEKARLPSLPRPDRPDWDILNLMSWRVTSNLKPFGAISLLLQQSHRWQN